MRSERAESAGGGGPSASPDWDAVYGLIVTTTGWRIADVDDLTLKQANSLLDYWYAHPPLHLMVQAALHIETRERKPQLATESEVRELAAMFGGK